MINDFFLFNPRNAYQNYAAATNSSKRILYTYMGKLLPNFGNMNYSTSGELSPLLKDPTCSPLVWEHVSFCAAQKGTCLAGNSVH